MALHQKALLLGWVASVDVVGQESDDEATTGGFHELFCLDTLKVPGCPDAATGQEGLFARQEHNRYWSDLMQALKFHGDRGRSDAFLALFRNEINPFAQGAALGFKAHRLRVAVFRYEQIVRAMFSPHGTQVLFDWPALSFKQAGEDWAAIMHAVLEDRMNAVADLADLRKRVFMNTGATDFAYAHHLMQQEYLLQVLVFALQHHWQGPLFSYEGQAGAVLDRGQGIVNQLNPDRNELGWVPGQIYFENSNPQTTSWLHYRSLIEGPTGGGGLLEQARETVAEGVAELQGALSDLDALETALFENKLALQDELLELCGDPDPGDPNRTDGVTNVCQRMLKKAAAEPKPWKILTQCIGATDTATKTACAGSGHITSCDDDKLGLDGDPCADVATLLSEGAQASTTCQANTDCPGEKVCDSVYSVCRESDAVLCIGGEACPDGQECLYGTCLPEGSAPALNFYPPVCVLNQGGGVTLRIKNRTVPCMGGEVGTLVQEKLGVDRQRTMVITAGVTTLFARLQKTVKMIEDDLEEQDDLLVTNGLLQTGINAITAANGLLSLVDTTADELGDATKCILIAGLAVGTDCPQAVGGVTMRLVVGAIANAIEIILTAVSDSLALEMEFQSAESEMERGKLAAINDIHEMVREVDDMIDLYDTLTQTALDLDIRIDEARREAQWAIDRYQKRVSFTADHLVGRQSGNVLVADALVKEASDDFQELVQLAYKMTTAFIHHYGVPPGDAANLRNAALGVVTLDDVADHVAALSKREGQYCGQEGIDCDAANNVEVLRFSLRDQLFPSLTDIVNRDGQVITAGEQFHNTITAAPFLRRRIRGGKPVDQIEIAIQLPLTLIEGGTSNRWLINPLTCNQLLDGRDPEAPAADFLASGNVALNAEGLHLGDGQNQLRYELIRGPTDYVRACHPESVQLEVGTIPVLQYPIRTFTVGYAPHSPEANQTVVPSYSTRSAPFAACIGAQQDNGSLEGDGCWRFFARDRTLASLDWKLVVPLTIDGGATENTWIRGGQLGKDERPVIEDLVLYFRYRTRPLSEQ